MKKVIVGILIGVTSMSLIGGTKTYELKTNTAETDIEQGIAVFIRSKPVKEYEFLGKVNMPEFVWSGRPKEMMNIAIRRAKNQYPEANGIIIQSDNFGSVDAIKVN